MEFVASIIAVLQISGKIAIYTRIAYGATQEKTRLLGQIEG